jgi:hypothetical protein
MRFYHRRKLHESFENRVYAELERYGFVVRDLTYHAHLDAEIVARLQRMRTPTALLVRTRADRIAVHQTHPIVAKIEVKTSGYHDGSFAIEAFPLAVHILEAKTFGAACLYICFQRTTQHEFGFWAGEIQQHIDAVCIPPYWHAFVFEYPEWLCYAFPDTPIRWLRYTTDGSNTPYVILAPSAVRSMAHWKTVLRDWLQGYTASMTEDASSLQTRFGVAHD